MPITIGSNIASIQSQRRLSDATQKVGSIYERLASGQRINHASDDAAGLAIASSLNSDSRVFNQGIRNLNDGISLLSISEGALSQLSGIVMRQMELAEQSANGTYTLKQRLALNNEANALVEEFNRVTQSTTFNGIRVFDTSNGDLRVQGGFGINGSINVLTNNQLRRSIGNLNFQSGVTYHSQNTSGMQILDINGDGKNDILSVGGGGGSDGELNVLLGNGDGTFLDQSAYKVLGGLNAQNFTVGDFNSDGVMDVATSTANGQIGILIGNGNGTFKLGVTYQTVVSNTAHFITSGDLNGDGFLDIVTSDQANNSYMVSLGNGNGTFKAISQTLNASGGTYDVRLQDFNGDGKLDLAGSDGSGALSIFIGRGDGSFGSRQAYSGGTNSGNLDFGDFNQDGILDAVLSNYGQNGLSVLLGNSDGSFKSAVTYAGGSATVSVRIGDFNGDGIIDLADTPSGGSNIEVRLGNGDGTFKYSASFAQASNTNGGLAIGDTNNDGVPDIIQDRIGVDGVAVFQQNAAYTTTIARLYLLSQSGAREALETSRTTLQRIEGELGTIGASRSRFSIALNVLGTSRENYLGAASRITDADIAHESADLVSTQILQKTGAEVLAQANLQPQLALKLLSR